MKLLRKRIVRNLPQDLYEKIYRLNFRENGTMQTELRIGRANPSSTVYWRQRGEKRYAYILMDGDCVVSWALIVPSRYDDPEVHFYTRASHRGRGLAVKVAEAIKKDFGDQLDHHPHDLKSFRFFKKLNLKNTRGHESDYVDGFEDEDEDCYG